jgi:hypothetical protein
VCNKLPTFFLMDEGRFHHIFRRLETNVNHWYSWDFYSRGFAPLFLCNHFYAIASELGICSSERHYLLTKEHATRIAGLAVNFIPKQNQQPLEDWQQFQDLIAAGGEPAAIQCLHYKLFDPGQCEVAFDASPYIPPPAAIAADTPEHNLAGATAALVHLIEQLYGIVEDSSHYRNMLPGLSRSDVATPSSTCICLVCGANVPIEQLQTATAIVYKAASGLRLVAKHIWDTESWRRHTANDIKNNLRTVEEALGQVNVLLRAS